MSLPPTRMLVLVLRAIAVVSLMALVPLFFPFSWMDALHRLMGLGDLPPLPIVEYMTRSLCLLYALHAGPLWIASTDIERFRPLITFMGTALVVAGIGIAGVDVYAGLPLFWILGEGLVIVALGVLVLVLQVFSSPYSSRSA